MNNMKLFIRYFKADLFEMEILRKFTILFMIGIVISFLCRPVKAESLGVSFELAKEANVNLRKGVVICKSEVINHKLVVHYVGKSDVDFLDCLIRFSDEKIDKLVITSGGGEVVASIIAGFIIKNQNIKLDVIGVCLSSCANYLATATPQLTVRDFSILGLHGGANMSDKNEIERLLYEIDNNNYSFASNDERDAHLSDDIKKYKAKKALIDSVLLPNKAQKLFQNITKTKSEWFELTQFYDAINKKDVSKYDVLVVPNYRFLKECISNDIKVNKFAYPSQTKRTIESILPVKATLIFLEEKNNNCGQT